MPLITKLFFFDEFNIAQKSEQSVEARINSFIAKYEPEYIEGALGKSFAALFNGSSEDRFTTLADMFKANPSPIAGYVFWHYQRTDAIFATGSGDSRGKAENATRSPESYRMRIAWNIMVERTREIHCYLRQNKDVYPEFDQYKIDRDLIIKQNDFGL